MPHLLLLMRLFEVGLTTALPAVPFVLLYLGLSACSLSACFVQLQLDLLTAFQNFTNSRFTCVMHSAAFLFPQRIEIRTSVWVWWCRLGRAPAYLRTFCCLT